MPLAHVAAPVRDVGLMPQGVIGVRGWHVAARDRALQPPAAHGALLWMARSGVGINRAFQNQRVRAVHAARRRCRVAQGVNVNRLRHHAAAEAGQARPLARSLRRGAAAVRGVDVAARHLPPGAVRRFERGNGGTDPVGLAEINRPVIIHVQAGVQHARQRIIRVQRVRLAGVLDAHQQARGGVIVIGRGQRRRAGGRPTRLVHARHAMQHVVIRLLVARR